MDFKPQTIKMFSFQRRRLLVQDNVQTKRESLHESYREGKGQRYSTDSWLAVARKAHDWSVFIVSFLFANGIKVWIQYIRAFWRLPCYALLRVRWYCTVKYLQNGRKIKPISNRTVTWWFVWTRLRVNCGSNVCLLTKYRERYVHNSGVRRIVFHSGQ